MIMMCVLNNTLKPLSQMRHTKGIKDLVNIEGEKGKGDWVRSARDIFREFSSRSLPSDR